MSEEEDLLTVAEEKICRRCGMEWDSLHVCKPEDLEDFQIMKAEMRAERAIARCEVDYETPEWYK